MVEPFEPTYLIDDIDSQYGYKLSQNTTSSIQLSRVSSPTTTKTPLTYTDSSADTNLDHRVVPIVSPVRNINGGGSVNFLRQMEYINKLQEIIDHPGFLTPLTSGTLSDVSDGTQQQPAQHPRQHYPTLIPPSTIPAANNARHNLTPSHQQPIIPNHHDFSRHTTTFGQDPRKSSTAATTTNYNDRRIIENQNDADTACLTWLNNSSSSSIHSEYINTPIYPTTSNHHDNSHSYYYPYHHTTPTTGSSNDSLSSPTTTEYLPSPPSFSSNEKHLSQFFIHHDEEYFAGSSNNHNILEMSPPSKQTRPSPLVMSRDISSTSLGSDLQRHLLMYHEYPEQEQGQLRFSNEGSRRSVELSDDLFPPLQMPCDQQNHPFQQQQQRRPRKHSSRQASSFSSSSWQPQQQRSRNKKHGHQVANSGTKSGNTASTATRTPLSEATQSALSSSQQQKRQPPIISSPNNKNCSTSPEHSVDDRPHQCVQCNRGFNRQQDLKRHLNSVHEKQLIHTCSVCRRSFSRRDSLLRHQKKCRSDLSFSTSLNADNNSVSSDSISNNDNYDNSIYSKSYHQQHHNHQNSTQQQHRHSLLYN